MKPVTMGNRLAEWFDAFHRCYSLGDRIEILQAFRKAVGDNPAAWRIADAIADMTDTPVHFSGGLAFPQRSDPPTEE